jgi:hypothetical protein
MSVGVAVIGALSVAACRDPVAPAGRYLVRVGGLTAPSVAAPGESVFVTFWYQLGNCSGLHSIDIRHRPTGLEFSVWGSPVPPENLCPAEEPPPVTVSYLLLPGSRQTPFTIVVRDRKADLHHTIVHE